MYGNEISMSEIGRALGISRQTVQRRLAEEGVELPGAQPSHLPVEDLVYRYLGHQGCDTIAAEYGVSAKAVQRQLRRAGLVLRPVSGSSSLRRLPAGFRLSRVALDQVARRLREGDSISSMALALAIPRTTFMRVLDRGAAQEVCEGDGGEEIMSDYQVGDFPVPVGVTVRHVNRIEDGGLCTVARHHEPSPGWSDVETDYPDGVWYELWPVDVSGGREAYFVSRVAFTVVVPDEEG